MKKNLLKSQRGVAMLMAMMTMTILAILAGELIYQSGVYTAMVFRTRDDLRATLLARSGLRFALLELKATQKAKGKVQAMGLGKNSTIVDSIWQTPITLPPPEIPGLSTIDAQTLSEFRKSLGMEGSFSIHITGDSERMSLNQIVYPTEVAPDNGTGGAAKDGDLVNPACSLDKLSPDCLNPPPGSPSFSGGPQDLKQKEELNKKVRASLAEIFDNILEKKRQDDDSFREKYPSLTGAILVGNLAAWMDPNTETDGDGRGKSEYYQSVQPTPYAIKEAPLASPSEFHMIKGIDDTIYKLITENFTVRGSNSLDVNKAPMLLIHALIPDLTPDALDKIEKRRTDDTQGGQFKDASDFWSYVESLGNFQDAKKKVEESGLKILEPTKSYHVVISATSGGASKTWLADVGPLPPKDPNAKPSSGTAGGTASATSTQTSTSTDTSTGTNDSSKKSSTASSDSDSLSIVYLKAE